MKPCFNFKREPRGTRVSIISVIPTVLFVGGIVFHWFPFRFKWIFLTAAITVCVELILYLITGLLSASQAAEHINRIIRQKKENAG